MENRASIGVIVSVASDAAAVLPGFDGIRVEIQGAGCRLLASTLYPTPSDFSLVVDDGPDPGSITLSTRPSKAVAPIPLPSNSLVGCGG